MYNYDAARYVLDELLERKDTEDIQTLFDNSRIMEEIIYNEEKITPEEDFNYIFLFYIL